MRQVIGGSSWSDIEQHGHYLVYIVQASLLTPYMLLGQPASSILQVVLHACIQSCMSLERALLQPLKQCVCSARRASQLDEGGMQATMLLRAAHMLQLDCSALIA